MAHAGTSVNTSAASGRTRLIALTHPLAAECVGRFPAQKRCLEVSPRNTSSGSTLALLASTLYIVVVCLLPQRNQRAFHFDFVFALHALKNHDVVLLLHHVAHHTPAGNRTVPTRAGATNVTLFTSWIPIPFFDPAMAIEPSATTHRTFNQRIQSPFMQIFRRNRRGTVYTEISSGGYDDPQCAPRHKLMRSKTSTVSFRCELPGRLRSKYREDCCAGAKSER